MVIPEVEFGQKYKHRMVISLVPPLPPPPVKERWVFSFKLGLYSEAQRFILCFGYIKLRSGIFHML